MSWRLVTDEWRLKLLALGLAVLMLGAVAFSQNPPISRTVSIGLNYNVADGIIILNPPSKIPVFVQGLADALSHLNLDNLTAIADASHAHPGAAVKLNVKATSTAPGVNAQNPAPIVVTIDSRATKELPVQVSARASPGWSLIAGKTLATCPGAVTPSPCKVHFDGPASWENNMVAFATVPGLVNVGSEDSPNQPVLLSNGNGLVDLSARTVPSTSLDVTSVNLHVEAAPGASSNTVPLVDLTPSHGPPPGYHVTGVTISPVTVVITGDPAILGRIQRITLPAVDLSHSTSTVMFTENIPYPDGTAGTVTTAQVTYTISPNPAVSPTS